MEIIFSSQLFCLCFSLDINGQNKPATNNIKLFVELDEIS